MATRNSGSVEPVNPSTTASYLDRWSTVIGNLVFENSARIEGRIQGDILAKGELILGEAAIVTGQVEGVSVVVAGTVRGDLRAAKRLEIRAPARIVGNLAAPVLVVEAGAVIDGDCNLPQPLSEEPEPANGTLAGALSYLGHSESEANIQKLPSSTITQRQREELRSRGYNDALIARMRAVTLNEPAHYAPQGSGPNGPSSPATERQRAELRSRGYDDATIDRLEAADAHRILGTIPLAKG